MDGFKNATMSRVKKIGCADSDVFHGRDVATGMWGIDVRDTMCEDCEHSYWEGDCVHEDLRLSTHCYERI